MFSSKAFTKYSRMKPILMVCLALLSVKYAVAQKDQLERIWFDEEKKSKIEIFKGSDGLFYGKIIWLDSPIDEITGKPRADKNNPDAKLRAATLVNLVFLKNFKKNSSDNTLYEDGSVYDPKSGKTYCGKLTFKGKELKLKGYICSLGSWFGRSSTWTLAE